MEFTLESLMEDLEKRAGLDKQASDESDKKEDKKEEKAEGKKDEGKKEEKSENPFAKAKEDLKDAEKEVKKGEQTKEAQEAGAALANEIMQKVAGLQLSNSTKEDTEMNKQASDAGKALADALLEKLANAGDQTTVNGIPDGVAPTKNQIDAAQQVAEQDAAIKPMPTGDGIKNTGTINQIFDSIVADALGQGAATPTEINHVSSSAAEGAVEDHAVPNQVQSESVEKTAAVISLVNSGFDFDDAVNMVKAAAEEIEMEQAEQVKQAAFASLIEQGVDFDLAAALVKSAGLSGAFGAAKKAIADQAVKASVGAENVAFGLMNRDLGIAGRGVKQLATNRLVQGGAAAGALGTGLAMHQKKASDQESFGKTTVRGARTAGRGVVEGLAGAVAGGATGAGLGALVGKLAKKELGTAARVGGTLGSYAGNVAGYLHGAGRSVQNQLAEKRAAVEALCDAGVDFDSAVELVSAKSMELYGA